MQIIAGSVRRNAWTPLVYFLYVRTSNIHAELSSPCPILNVYVHAYSDFCCGAVPLKGKKFRSLPVVHPVVHAYFAFNVDQLCWIKLGVMREKCAVCNNSLKRCCNMDTLCRQINARLLIGNNCSSIVDFHKETLTLILVLIKCGCTLLCCALRYIEVCTVVLSLILNWRLFVIIFISTGLAWDRKG